MDGMLELCDPAIEGHQSIQLVGTAGVFQGRDGMRAMFAELSEGFDELRFDPEELLQTGDRILTLVRISATGAASGVPVEAPLAHVWTVGEHGFTAFEVFANPTKAAAAVGIELPADAG